MRQFQLNAAVAALLTVFGTYCLAVAAQTQALAEETPPSTQNAVPVDPAAAAAATELMEVIGASKKFDGLVEMLKTHVTANATDQAAAKASTDGFAKLADKFSGYKKQMMDETAALYARKFTAAEIKTVTEFYKSGTGVKFLAEMPDLMNEAGGIGQKFAVQMMKDLKEAKDAK